jgi:orotidine-5'-phosphate decarboxylase
MAINPVFVALDTADPAQALALGRAVASHVGGLKLGLEFFMANGPAGVRAIASLGLPLFLDVKLHDIPNTVAGALAALAALDVAIVNVHAGGGQAMLEAARAAIAPPTRLIAVTVLTSLDDADLTATGVADGAAAQVMRLATLARDAGLDGLVCSAAEVAGLRAAWPDALLVVPGIRPEGAAQEDQKRVMAPREALAAGASILVIGRPITGAADPTAAAAAIAAELAA